MGVLVVGSAVVLGREGSIPWGGGRNRCSPWGTGGELAFQRVLTVAEGDDGPRGSRAGTSPLPVPTTLQTPVWAATGEVPAKPSFVGHFNQSRFASPVEYGHFTKL